MKRMNTQMIYGAEATLEDLCELHEQGFDFLVEDGVITDVLHS